MKTKMVEVREGEDMGPIDWAHPMALKLLSSKRKCASLPGDPLLHPILVILEKNPGKYLLTTDGGMPRCGWRQVLAVRMYDGWPHWTPTPSVLMAGVLGGSEWHSFDMISDAMVPS